MGIRDGYNATPAALLKCTRGPQDGTGPRKVAMYLSRELSTARLVKIADFFI